MITFLIRLCVLIASYVGLWELCKDKFRIHPYFAPLFTLAVQFVLLFAAGILNYLREVTFAMYFGGVFLFVYYFWKKKWKLITQYLNWGYLVFAGMFFALTLYLHNRELSYIDNFTHWAVVVKNMLSTDRFPTVLDKAVTFHSYPLGASALIYYFCNMTRAEEWVMMLAQGYIMLCAIVPVFAYGKKNQPICAAIVVVMTGFLMSYSIPVTELLVDTVLPLVGGGVLLFADHEYLRKAEKTPKEIYLLTPLLFWVMNIKDSGLFFVAAVVVFLLLAGDRSKENKKAILLICLILLMGRSLWNHHCDYVFGNVSSSQHAVSLSRYTKIFREKSMAYNLQVVKDILLYAFTRGELHRLLAWFGILGVGAWKLLNAPERKRTVKIAFGIAAAYGIYVLSVLGVYLFSMPEYEGLTSLDRYVKTIDIAIYLQLAAFALALISRIQKRILSAGMGAAFVGLSLLNWNLQMQSNAQSDVIQCTPEIRAHIEAPIWEYGVIPDFSYLILGEEKPDISVFERYLWAYHMDTSAVKAMPITYPSQLEEETEYDYVIILDEDNPIIEAWVQENYPDRVGKSVIQHFD